MVAEPIAAKAQNKKTIINISTSTPLGRNYTLSDTVEVIVAASDAVRARHPGQFFGAQVIYSALRSVDRVQLAAELEEAVKLRVAFPETVVGFDLVGEEDPGHSLYYCSDLLLAARAKAEALGTTLDFFFHAGETNWYTDGTFAHAADNVYDAVLLGARRIGHGLALAKLPDLVQQIVAPGATVQGVGNSPERDEDDGVDEYFNLFGGSDSSGGGGGGGGGSESTRLVGLGRSRSIASSTSTSTSTATSRSAAAGSSDAAPPLAVEVCPISNQVLEYVDDFRDHPATTLLQAGVALTLNPDDPAVLGYDSVGYDWLVAYTSWDLDLASLKQLARNSIEHSMMSVGDKAAALAAWQVAWQAWASRVGSIVIAEEAAAL